MDPIIQWVGGKKRLLSTISFLLPNKYENYHEIFLGGACLLLNLIPKVSYSIERNNNIYMIYENIKYNVEEIIVKLKDIETKYLLYTNILHRKEYYIEMRKLFNESNSSLEKSILLLFLNKTCFNALYRENSKGKYNVPFGNGKDCKICDENKLRVLNKFLNENNTHIYNEDFEYCKNNVKEGDFVYIDPPYYPLKATSFTGYIEGGFSNTDHDRLIELIKYLDSHKINIMLSNSNNDYFKEQLSMLNIFEISIARTLNSDSSNRGKTKCEMIMTNYNIKRVEEIKVKPIIYDTINLGDIVTVKLQKDTLNYMIGNTIMCKVSKILSNLLINNSFKIIVSSKVNNLVYILITN
jgi:DNA adenine methylase